MSKGLELLEVDAPPPRNLAAPSPEDPRIENARPAPCEGRFALLLFSVTLFVSSALLFLVQPMFAKMVLPLLGGTPAVWNTCMVFFQAALLAGYGYAHLSTAWLGVRVQAAFHLVVLMLPLAALPIGIGQGWNPPTDQNPVAWLLTVLAVSVGFPFFAVATSAPLLQKWFASTRHPSANDPYFLYRASNLGSLLALVAYPVLMEPSLRLAEQSWTWAVGYGLLTLLTAACALTIWRSRSGADHRPERRASELDPVGAGLQARPGEPARAEPLSARRRLRWVALSFVPSSLMLGVTTYLSTDIAAVPLLWIVPLVLYLLTFVLAFGAKPLVPHAVMVRALPLVLLPLVILILINATQPPTLLIPLHLLTFFVATMVCHGELAKSRPSTAHLTEFYLWMSVGGVLGGLFNALVAPMVFPTVIEYPLAMVLACLLRPARPYRGQTVTTNWKDVALPAALGVVTVALVLGLRATGLTGGKLGVLLALGIPAVLCFGFSRRPVRFGLGVGMMLVASAFFPDPFGRVLYTERTFFGVHRIRIDPERRFHLLFHGSTAHGSQSLEASQSREALTYFHRTGPIGQLFTSLPLGSEPKEVAVIGLGTGTLASYGRPGQRWTFYEIDPAVERIARDGRYFTFLRESAANVDVVLGDARLKIQQARDGQYGLIVVDAFSSDSLPVHLVTREAVRIYLSKLADGGIIAFNTSNRYLFIPPVIEVLAKDAGLMSLTQIDVGVSPIEEREGKLASIWVVAARRSEDLRRLSESGRWITPGRLPGSLTTRVWSDDFSNVLSVFRWM